MSAFRSQEVSMGLVSFLLSHSDSLSSFLADACSSLPACLFLSMCPSVPLMTHLSVSIPLFPYLNLPHFSPISSLLPGRPRSLLFVPSIQQPHTALSESGESIHLQVSAHVSQGPVRRVLPLSVLWLRKLRHRKVSDSLNII